jgi:hypothetical protein
MGAMHLEVRGLINNARRIGAGESLRHHLQNLPLSIGQGFVHLLIPLIGSMLLLFRT